MKEEISKEDLLLMVKQLDLSLDARMNRIMGKKDLSGSQAAVLCYLLRPHPEGSCIRELCGNCTVCGKNCFGVSGKRGRHSVFGAEDRLRQLYQ